MSKLYLVHGNTWYEGYGEYQNLYGVFTDRKTAEKVKTEITLKLYDKETHNICTNVESISDIEVYIKEVDVNQVTNIELGGYNGIYATAETFSNEYINVKDIRDILTDGKIGVGGYYKLGETHYEGKLLIIDEATLVEIGLTLAPVRDEYYFKIMEGQKND